jgi:hypothetical protein
LKAAAVAKEPETIEIAAQADEDYPKAAKKKSAAKPRVKKTPRKV